MQEKKGGMLSKSQISFIRALQQKKQRNEQQLFIAEGLKVVRELLLSNYTIESLYHTPELDTETLALAAKVLKKAHIYEVSHADMERISALSTASSVLVIVKMPVEVSLSCFSEDFDELVFVLDDVKDPGNLGTIIRIADWFGIQKIVCSSTTVDVYNPKTIQATMGSMTRVELVYTDLHPLFEQKHPSTPVYGALLEGNNLYQEQLNTKGFIVMGSESHGISKEIRPFITHPIHIPGLGNAESLNVAVATAVVAAEFKREILRNDGMIE